MTSVSRELDLKPIGGRVYIGRKNGELARKHFKIDEIDRENSFPVKVIFPADAKTLTSSFFLGMFGLSVRTAGSKEKFLARYVFDTPAQIELEILESINEALDVNQG